MHACMYLRAVGSMPTPEVDEEGEARGGARGVDKANRAGECLRASVKQCAIEAEVLANCREAQVRAGAL